MTNDIRAGYKARVSYAAATRLALAALALVTFLVGCSSSPHDSGEDAKSVTERVTALPDLVVTAISVLPTNVGVGQPATFSATVKNQGSAATPAGVVIGAQFDVDGTEVSWSDTDTQSLAPGQSVTLTANSGPSGSSTWSATFGSHQLQAWVNDVNRFPESDTSNNKLVVPLNVGPDLIVTNVTASPSTVAPGQPVTFSATVMNQGTAPTPAGVVIGVQFDVDGTEVSWSDTDTQSLAPGQSVTLTANSGPSGVAIWSAHAGPHTVQAWVNDVNRFPETNTTNNTLQVPLSIGIDLTVTSVGPTDPTVGNPITFSAIVKNVGTSATPPGTIIGVAFAVDGTTVSWSDTYTQSLSPGQSVLLFANSGPSGSSTWTATSGNHSLQGWVDDVNRMNDVNRSNNKFITPLTSLVLENPQHLIGSDGGTIRGNNGKVVLQIPPGAVSNTTAFTITPTPTGVQLPYSGLLQGTRYDFGPDGLTFSVPATLTIAYDPATVPAGVSANSLVILSSLHGAGTDLTPLTHWEERPSSADVSTAHVSGTIEHFSGGGVGEPVARMEATPSSLGLIPGTEQTVHVLLFGADNARLVHAIDLSSADVTKAGVFSAPGLDQFAVLAPSQGSIGDTTVTATVRNSPPDLNVTQDFPVKVGLATLAFDNPSSSSSNDGFNDARTVAISASADLTTGLTYDINISDSPTTASFSAFTYLGQEVAVFDYPGFGMGDNDDGGQNTQGAFSSTFGWPFVTGLQFSSMHVNPGETKKMEYSHMTGHVMRYVRGTCAQRFPLSTLFDTIATQMEAALVKSTADFPLGLLSTSRRCYEAQPHFRGQVGLSQLNKAPIEAGFWFAAQYDARVPVINAGVTVGMNPGYSITRRTDGFIDVSLINDHPNVQVINDVQMPHSNLSVSDYVREQLRTTLPQTLAATVNDQLLQPLPAALGATCDPSAGDAATVCLNETIAGLGLACKAGLSAEACIADQVLTVGNFACLQGGACGFHPIVQEVNVLPDELELVFAPDPLNPVAQLDQFYRALSVFGGTALCAPDESTETLIAQPVTSSELGPEPCPG